MKQDMGLIAIIVISSILTSLAWIGDIISWAIIGNGFTIDVILLFVAIGFTIVLVYFYKKKKKIVHSFQSLSDKELRFKLEDTSLDRNTKEQLEDELDSRRRKAADSLVSKENATFFTCSTCGEVIKSRDNNCSACNSQRPLCAVCQAPLSPDDTIVRTSCCQCYAHKEHILNWISMKGHCPNCLQKIKENDLASIVFIDYSSDDLN